MHATCRDFSPKANALSTDPQMQAMMRMGANMNPQMMQQAQQMGNMSAQDWERAKRQMDGMDPSQMAQQMKQATDRMAAQEDFVFRVSTHIRTLDRQRSGSWRCPLFFAYCSIGIGKTPTVYLKCSVCIFRLQNYAVVSAVQGDCCRHMELVEAWLYSACKVCLGLSWCACCLESRSHYMR